MKLKFRADKEDVAIFISFSIFLLYVIAIAIVNLSTLAKDGTFSGLNPFPAFEPEYIAATLLFYFLAILALIMSVSSKFFEMEKGIGFTMDKKDKGYSRWAKDKEIENQKNVEVININDKKTKFAGTPLMYKKDNIWVDNGESHTLVIGATGSGKTQTVILPTVKVLSKKGESMIITDPKGEIYEKTSVMLREKGYQILLLNFRDPQNGNSWNPMTLPYKMYKSGAQDKAIELLDDLALNILYDESNKNADPFWEKAEGMFLQALFYYVWLEVPPKRRNFETVLKLMGKAEVKEKGKPSQLDIIMSALEETSPLGVNHPAVKQYKKCMRGAGDTVRSIIISANSRLAFLENKKILRILSKDELNLADIGIGANGDCETKTALFCVIPDSDKSYNFIIGMLYTQIFQELYYQADFNFGGRLPIHVTFMLDEFSNVALPDDFCSLLSTMRSREISSVIIIQNLAQIKALFKDTWETIPGNCDTLIYLGGNEQSTHKYISELLGKGTIEKKSSGETRGRQGSSSRNYDVLGRELMTPDEARKFDNKKCLIFIRGFDPIVDNKFNPFTHPAFNQTADGKGKSYEHIPRGDSVIIGPPFEILNRKSLEYYERLKEKGKNVYIDKLTMAEFMLLKNETVIKRLKKIEPQKENSKVDMEISGELEYQEDMESANDTNEIKRWKKLKEDTVTNRMIFWKFSKEQCDEVKKEMREGVPVNVILNYFYPDVSVEKMRKERQKYGS